MSNKEYYVFTQKIKPENLVIDTNRDLIKASVYADYGIYPLLLLPIKTNNTLREAANNAEKLNCNRPISNNTTLYFTIQIDPSLLECGWVPDEENLSGCL